MTNKYKPVQALQRGLALLEAVSQVREGVNLKTLAGEIGCSPAATHHLIHTLLAAGYVRRLEHPARYTLGPSLFRLAENQRNDRFYEVAHAAMRTLAASLPGATLYLSEAIAGATVVRALMTPEAPGRVVEDGRRTLPPYTSAGSLAHLAFWPLELREEHEARYAFNVHGLPFWGSRAAYEAALATLRAEKAFLMPETAPTRLKLALPLLGPRGGMLAALTLQWNQTDLKQMPKKKRFLLTLARETAATLTRELAS